MDYWAKRYMNEIESEGNSFAQWRYSNQWSNREVLLLLVENYTQYPAISTWNTVVLGNFCRLIFEQLELNSFTLTFYLSMCSHLSITISYVAWQSLLRQNVVTFHAVMKLSSDSLKEIDVYSLDAPQTRKSLVKGERFIRSVWRAWVDNCLFDIQWWKKFDTDKNLLIAALYIFVSHTKSKIIPDLNWGRCSTLIVIASRPFG